MVENKKTVNAISPGPSQSNNTHVSKDIETNRRSFKDISDSAPPCPASLQPQSAWDDPDIASNYTAEAQEFDQSLLVLKQALAKIQLERGDDILDLGAGTGLNSVLISERFGVGRSIYGSDISAAMHNQSVYLNYADFQITDLAEGVPRQYREKIDQGKMRVGLINCVGAFHFLSPEGIRTIIRDIAHCLRVDGTAVLTMGLYNQSNDWTGFCDIETDNDVVGKCTTSKFKMHYYDRQFIKSLLQENNLDIVEWNEFSLSNRDAISTEEQQPSVLVVCKKRPQPQL